MGALLFCVAGSIVIGIGYQQRLGAPRRFGLARALGLCAIGVALMAVGAARVPHWGERISIMCAYALCGSVFGEMLLHANARRRAGAVLARLGTVNPYGGVIFVIVVGTGGLISLTFTLFEPQPFGVAMVIGQYLFFISIAGLATRRWRMTQFGFVGVGRFIAWPEIAEYRWSEPGVLSLTTSSNRSRPFVISIPPKVRDQVEGFLRERLPDRRREGSA